MQFLSNLSLLGLIAFIAFSTVSRADGGWVERHEDYSRNTDPVEIIENEYREEIYDRDVEVNVNVHNHNSGSNWSQPSPPVLPYPNQGYGNGYGYGRPTCRVFKLRTHPDLWDVWLGNGIIRRGNYYYAQQVYWSLVNSGQCVRGNW